MGIAASMTATAPWVLYVGYLAALLTALCLPVQLYALYAYRNDAASLRSVRPMVAVITAITAVMWLSYGLRFDAMAVTLAQIPILVGLVILALVYASKGVWSKRMVIGVILALRFVGVMCANSSRITLGFNAVVLTTMLWIPTAVSGIGVRSIEHHTMQPVFATARLLPWALMPRITVLIYLCWWVYGVGMHDVWLWLASPGVVAHAGMWLWAVYAANRPIKDSEILAASAKIQSYDDTTAG